MKTLLIGLLLTNLSHAGEPIFACRAKSEVISATVNMDNNSGCIITRKNKNTKKLEVLMLFTIKDEGGFTLPGGKSANLKNDRKEVKKSPDNNKASGFIKLADEHKIEYREPVVCSASRETKEETGLEVIVGDLFVAQKYFLAFLCYAPNINEVEKAAAMDKEEIADENSLRWINEDDFNAMKNNIKGESKERFTYTNNEILEKVFKEL